MKPSRRQAWLFFSIAFAIVTLPAFAGLQIDHKRFGYSLTLPDDWERIPGDVIKEYTRAVGSRVNQSYEDGFQRSAGGVWLQHPYILLQANEKKRVPEGELARMKSFRSGLESGMGKAEKQLNSLVSGMSLGETYYDKETKRFWIRFSMNVAGAGDIRAISCGFLTQKGMLLFHCYAKAAEFDSLLPQFYQILDSVKISEELRYKPRVGDSLGLDFFRIGRGALIGAVVGLVVWFIRRPRGGKEPPVPPPLPQ